MGSFITTTMRISVLFVVVLLISSNVLLFTRAQEEETFKVGLVRDVYLRYPWVDTYTYQGVQYWADWMNARGGLKYGNITRRIEVLTEDGSSLDTSQLAATIKGKYQKLINTYGCQLVVSPYGTSRTLAAMQGSDPLNVINLAFSSGLPALATLTTAPKKHVFSWGHRADVSSIQVAQYYSKLAKTMVLFCSTESGAQTFCNGAIKVFKDVGMTNLRTTYVNVSSVDSSDVLAAVVPRLRVAVDGLQPDLMVAVFLPDQFQGLMTAFESVKPNIKAAVLLSPLWTNIQHVPTELDNVGNGWVGITPFPYTIEVGSKDAFGGSSLEFVRGFEQKYGSPPIPFPAFAAGMLYSWTLAVQKAQSINTTLVEQAMIDMEEIYTVAGPLKFDGNHSNIYPKWYPFQLRGGEGVAITKIEDIVYPAPFPWLIQSTRTVEKVNIALVVGIVVPVGVVVIVGIIIAVIYTRRQRSEAVQALHKSEEGERRNYKIDFEAIETQALLGSGSFGHVYKGEYRGTAVAIKKLKQQTMSKQQLDEFAREASVMVGLRHPNILLFMGVCLKPSNLCIITELMSRGSLYDVIVNKDIELSFSVKIRLALDALRGLQFIHSAGFIHRDLKSPNLLVDKSWNIKIADFGLSCAKGNAASNTQVSLLWTAPEVLEFETDSYTDKSDVYSFAIILWELMARKLPYEGMAPAAIHTAVVGGKRPPLDPSWGDQVCKVITDAWAQNPKNRPSIKDIRAVMESIPINENDNPMVLYNNTSSYSSGTRERFPKPPCAMVFVEVENEYKLWKNDPHMTLKALKMYGEVLRTQLKRVGGCESRSDDESPSNANTFIAAFHDAVSAINFAMRVQSDLLQLEWPTGLANIPYTATEYSGADDLIYKGLRVSMGIHHGTPTVLTSGKEDKQVEYKGLIVSEGKQIARCAGGGQILLSGEVYNIISNNNQNQRLDPYVVETVTSIKLEKRTELLALYEVISKNLRERLGARSEYLEEIQRGSSIPSDPPVLLQEWIIPYEELKFGQLIGTGASGDVFSGFYNNQKVAIKQFVKQAIKDDLLLDMRAESATLYNIKHENVLKFIGMCTKHSHICLVTELMEKGDLASLLYKQQKTDLSWPVKMNIIADVAKGLANLHSINIIHRDIKSANIFIGNDWKARIGDFGFAVVKMANATMTQVGTVAWTCPEIFEGGTYSEKTDIYGFGVVLWEIVFGKKPWEGVHTMRIINYVLNGSRPPMTNPPSTTPPVILDLITACWHQDPTQRPSATEILAKLNVTSA